MEKRAGVDNNNNNQRQLQIQRTQPNRQLWIYAVPNFQSRATTYEQVVCERARGQTTVNNTQASLKICDSKCLKPKNKTKQNIKQNKDQLSYKEISNQI